MNNQKLTYKQALKTPKKGWKYAEQINMTAAISQSASERYCLNPEAVFAWANKHNINLEDYYYQEFVPGKQDLVLLLLNDKAPTKPEKRGAK